MSDVFKQIVEAALARDRTRRSWNERLTHWERPASDHEEDKIQRAARMARALVARSPLLMAEGVTVEPQGSYFNNTNVRLEADMDLRIQMPGVKVHYGPGVDPVAADGLFEYVDTGRSLNDVNMLVRNELARRARDMFGDGAVDDSGNKAIAVDGLSGSRADCDLVPAFTLSAVMAATDGLYTVDGVAILSRDGGWTMNFPRQHHANGIDKRARTRHRFKRVVRMLKRLNYELAELGTGQRLPGFLIESLAYAVEDDFYLVESDDRYDRLCRVLNRLAALLSDSAWTEAATEINDIKFLFHPAQSWSVAMAQNFVAAAILRLGGE